MDKLIKNIVIVLLLLSTGLTTFAQGGRPPAYKQSAKPMGMRRPNANKRVQAIKKGYMAQQLSLTQEQGTRFWPVFDQYQDEYTAVLRARRLNNLSPQTGTDQFDKDLSYQQQIVSIQKHYYDEFCKIMPPEKASQVFKTEKQFNFEVLRRLKEIPVPADNN